MKRIAILGGGIAGLAAAYELELARKRGADLDWQLYEATGRLGGTVETTVHNGFVMEGGPDAWITEKPWARDLAVELGLEADLLPSNDAAKRTYILIDGSLEAMPAHMRMMVPHDLATLDDSPLFSQAAKDAYAAELASAAGLREAAPDADESVASFVHRHFGDEVLAKLAAPLLGGVFGGDVHTLSVRSVMSAFVAMEQEHGSLIAALQARTAAHGDKPPASTFTSLRRGMGSLVDAIVATLPTERLHLGRPARSLKRESRLWCVRSSASPEGKAGRTDAARRTSKRHVQHVLLATPVDVTRDLLTPLDPEAAALLPTEATSALLVSFAWPAATAATFAVPPGFGFLVPSQPVPSEPVPSKPVASEPGGALAPGVPQLLACTFVDQKFAHRAPSDARLLRVFFGGPAADALSPQRDAFIAADAFTQLCTILGPLPAPDPALTTVRRWPRSLPQYAVGHLDRMAALDTRIAALGGLTLLGNAFHGVGVPDLIRAARAAARALAAGD